MNKTIIINNQAITTLEDLRSCFNQPEAAVSNSFLFNELIDRFVDGDIEGFLRVIGEKTLAEKVKGIPIVDSDSELMRELIAAMTELDVNVEFNPLEYIKVEKRILYCLMMGGGRLTLTLVLLNKPMKRWISSSDRIIVRLEVGCI